jgi:hypothetical protein
MPPHLNDYDFERARERFFVRSVREAVEETYWAAAWRPSGEVQAALTRALDRRGIDPEPEAVRRGAELISRGRKPSILRSGGPVRV